MLDNSWHIILSLSLLLHFHFRQPMNDSLVVTLYSNRVYMDEGSTVHTQKYSHGTSHYDVAKDKKEFHTGDILSLKVPLMTAQEEQEEKKQQKQQRLMMNLICNNKVMTLNPPVVSPRRCIIPLLLVRRGTGAILLRPVWREFPDEAFC